MTLRNASLFLDKAIKSIIKYKKQFNSNVIGSPLLY